MKAIMMMFDSLNRHLLPNYGCDWVKAPNFERLRKRTVTFDNSYVGSMPCMPARRELHTGRLNFLHRSWGPIEPFDDSMPQILHDNGIHTHLITDHQHYWEDGGATYHNRYSTYEFIRGQEGDKWYGQVADEPPVEGAEGRSASWEFLEHQDRKNRKLQLTEEDFPQVKTMKAGLEFLQRNANEDNWFLQIETFDPHEPYFVPDKYKAFYPDFDFDKVINDWPAYKPVTDEDRHMIEHMRYLNAAMITMCDHYLGQLLDLMDKLNLWDDTLFIVNTDHGFLLGEHDWWAKSVTPFYNEIARTPLFVWDPRTQRKAERCNSLVQSIDWAPTILDYFNLPIPEDVEGISLAESVKSTDSLREGALFGLFGAHVNVTDGRYIYMRAPVEDNLPLYQYTLMPTHMRCFFTPSELKTLTLSPALSFTKGCQVMKMGQDNLSQSDEPKELRGGCPTSFTTMLFDLKEDPKQEHPIDNKEIEEKMIRLLTKLMQKHHAPSEQYIRLGLDVPEYNL